MTTREDMIEPAEIIDHMARDVLVARRSGQSEGEVDLAAFGWTTDQVAAHAAAGHDLATDPDFVSREAVERMAAAAG